MPRFRLTVLSLVLSLCVTDLSGQNKIIHQLAGGTVTGPSDNGKVKVIGSLGPIGLSVQPGQKSHSGFYTLAFVLNQLEDKIPPVISFTPVHSIDRGTRLDISTTITDAPFNQPVNAKLFYRAIGKKAFDSASLTRTGTTTTYIIHVEADKFDAMGLEYYFKAVDQANNPTTHPPTAKLYTYSIEEAKIPASLLSFGSKEEHYRMISLPHKYDDNISALLGDEFGDPKQTEWRLLTYTGSGFSEYPGGFSTFERAKGYWLIARNPKELILAPSKQAPENNQASLYEMQLHGGWNQVGNPYTLPVDWNNVRTFNEPALVGKLHVYEGGYNNPTDLLPYQGGYVYLDGPAQTIRIPFKGQTSGSRTQNGPAEGWQLPLAISNDITSNRLGGIGMHPKAAATKDKYDEHNPPRFSTFAEINFAHPEHPLKNFCFDVVPEQEEYVWTFTMTSSSGEGRIDWDPRALPPETEDLFLYDEVTGSIIDMRTESHFLSITPRTIKIYYGRGIDQKIRPSEVWSGNPFPNPFHDEVTLSFGLPGNSEIYSVSVDVFNAQGQRVRRLIEDHYSSGFHHVKWNGQDNESLRMASGVYFYKLTAASSQGQRALTGRIVLIN
jgi:hypothetical protein